MSDISDAKQTILLQSRALLALIETAEEGRKARAKTLIKTEGVYWHGQESSVLQGGVRSSGGGSYLVRVQLRHKRSGIWLVQDTECECHDGKTRLCKHVLALAGARLLSLRKEWHELSRAEELIAKTVA